MTDVKMIRHLALFLILMIVGGSRGAASPDDVIAKYDLLDEAIENEIDGIDFSDMDGVADYAICGVPTVEAEYLTEFVRRFNPSFDSKIAENYIELSKIYGLRGDIALCQAILETGWFRFDRGTVVTPEQHNYCGLGVTMRGRRGASFDTVRDGVAAHLQHLYAYVSERPLPDGELLVDPRFKSVRRASAVNWSDLSNRWAMNDEYGRKVLKIFEALIEYKLSRLQ